MSFLLRNLLVLARSEGMMVVLAQISLPKNLGKLHINYRIYHLCFFFMIVRVTYNLILGYLLVRMYLFALLNKVLEKHELKIVRKKKITLVRLVSMSSTVITYHFQGKILCVCN